MKRSPLDLSHFTHGSELERDKLARDLLEDLSQRGFTTLVNHGLSDLAVKRLFEQVRARQLSIDNFPAS